MTPLGDRASFEVYPFVDGSRRILGSNYGFADPAIDFPRYAAWTLDGRLPVERLIDRRIGLDDLEDAFDAMRAGRVRPPGHRLRSVTSRAADLRRALILSGLSIAWSGVVGVLATYAALASGSLTMLGFGVDAVIDAIASSVLIWRFRVETRDRNAPHGSSERRSVSSGSP